MTKRLTTTEVADRLNVGKSTVNLWCNQGRFPNAQSESTPRGPVWMIPEGDLKSFVLPTPGRPPKQPASGSNAALTTAKAKKGGKK
jgi:excisionase family DNA binding protein